VTQITKQALRIDHRAGDGDKSTAEFFQLRCWCQHRAGARFCGSGFFPDLESEASSSSHTAHY
jgi:hypothetical protein